jgi:hypothetical protein
MTVIKNKTGHTVTIVAEDGDLNATVVATFEPDGKALTIMTHEHQERIKIGQVGTWWADVADIEYRGLSEDLPRGGFGLCWIVPLEVALAERRRDFLVPTDPVYGDDGKRTGFKTLARVM